MYACTHNKRITTKFEKHNFCETVFLLIITQSIINQKQCKYSIVYSICMYVIDPYICIKKSKIKVAKY